MSNATFKLLMALYMLVIILGLSLLFSVGGCDVQAKDVINEVTKVNSAKVVGIFTYRNCLNACGINHGHYIEFANVAIREGCIQDPNCTTCMDACMVELKENNPEIYQAILDHTPREE